LSRERPASAVDENDRSFGILYRDIAMVNVFLVAGARTPIGAFQGALSEIAAPDLGAVAIAAVCERAGIRPRDVDEVIMGNVISAGVGQAPARQAALRAGLPDTIAAVTINKVCGSGLKAVMLASQAIRAGDAKCIIAGGMENMSLAPHLLSSMRGGVRLGNATLSDAMLVDGLSCAFNDCPMGELAEHIAATFNVTRTDQDEYAVESQIRARDAVANGWFADEIVPVSVSNRRGDTIVECDEGPRPETTLETLQQLRPVFQKKGTVTAGNSSIISDGAAAIAVVDQEMAETLDKVWKARIVAGATSGTSPRDLFIAPVLAIQQVLDRANLTLNDIDLFEINEAFAAQMVACLRELKLSADRVNVCGGGISLGHPIGASGARVLVTLLASMKRTGARRGLASLCLGGGNAVAMVVEAV
jgi:acetyl-CoA C-acetyltransferase